MNTDPTYPGAHDVWYTIALEMSRQRNSAGELYDSDSVIKYATAVADAYKEYVSKLS